MKDIVLLNRIGIQVVAGEVTEVAKIAGLVVIKNNDETQFLALRCTAEKMQQMGIREGSKVIAAIRPDQQTIAMAEGKEIDIVPIVEPFVLRYTGGFDFEKMGVVPEQHVFCGVIKELKVAGNGLLIKMQWRHRYEAEARWLFYGNPRIKAKMEPYIGKQIIALAGDKSAICGMDAYPLQNMGLF